MNKHAELMKQYAKDWAADPKPWQFWEVYGTVSKCWRGLEHHPEWLEHLEYRRKPLQKLVTIPPSHSEPKFFISLVLQRLDGITISEYDLCGLGSAYDSSKAFDQMVKDLK